MSHLSPGILATLASHEPGALFDPWLQATWKVSPEERERADPKEIQGLRYVAGSFEVWDKQNGGRSGWRGFVAPKSEDEARTRARSLADHPSTPRPAAAIHEGRLLCLCIPGDDA